MGWLAWHPWRSRKTCKTPQIDCQHFEQCAKLETAHQGIFGLPSKAIQLLQFWKGNSLISVTQAGKQGVSRWCLGCFALVKLYHANWFGTILRWCNLGKLWTSNSCIALNQDNNPCKTVQTSLFPYHRFYLNFLRPAQAGFFDLPCTCLTFFLGLIVVGLCVSSSLKQNVTINATYYFTDFQPQKMCFAFWTQSS